jgi:chloramphenicol O-acetyltransferase type A
MRTYIDVGTWHRRDAFHRFRHYDKPFFNVCTRLDVAGLRAAAREAGIGLATAVYHLTLRLAHETEDLRLRLDGDRVYVADTVGAGAVVLRTDGSITFSRLPYHPDLGEFARRSREIVEAARAPGSAMFDDEDDTEVLHVTTLPWVHFTSFSHARRWDQEDDSIPKLAFGRADPDGDRLWMPMSVEVHHSLMDGLHVGLFVQRFEQELAALRGS